MKTQILGLMMLTALATTGYAESRTHMPTGHCASGSRNVFINNFQERSEQLATAVLTIRDVDGHLKSGEIFCGYVPEETHELIYACAGSIELVEGLIAARARIHRPLVNSLEVLGITEFDFIREPQHNYGPIDRMYPVLCRF